MIFNDIEDFWVWKRNIAKKEFCKGKNEYNEFISLWNEIKEKRTEMPEKGTNILTDYYSWKAQGKPKENFAGSSEQYFEKYYNEKIKVKISNENI